MKKTNRQQNSIVIGFIFTFVLFILGISYIIISLLPNIYDIEKNKVTVYSGQLDNKKILKMGLSYSGFNKLLPELNSKKNNIPDKRYLKQLISDIDESFYNNNFINTGSISYKNFLKNKKKDIDKSIKKSSSGLYKDIKSILPTYSNISLIGNENALTDFKFINYLENIFNGFNLEYTGNLGINNIKNYYKGDGDLGTSIFYIPLDIGLKGSKKDIINFIHYFEYVGSVEIDKNNSNKLKRYNDDFIKTKIPFLLENTFIYNHQIADISYIKIPKYLDSSDTSNIRGDGINFIDFIKSNKANIRENIKINIGLRFYTIGAQNIRIIEIINNIISTNYLGLQRAIKLKLKNPKLVKSRNPKLILELKNLNKINNTIKGIGKDIKSIKKRLQKKTNLDILYKEVIIYKRIIKQSSKINIDGKQLYIYQELNKKK